jgi:arginine-tRNA-protein transferase
MQIITDQFTTSNEPCSYLDDRDQTMHYMIIKSCTTTFNQQLIERGWRRFGHAFFRPVCEGCTKCESIKIDALTYKFSKSERRTIRKNEDIHVVIRKPKFTQDHFDLYNKYHYHMQEKKGWDFKESSVQHYIMSFVQGSERFGYEICYYHEGKLIGVDLIDMLKDGISSIYFFYDPDYSKRSLGRYSIYQQIALAKQNHLRWIYLGYYVEENNSLNYKINYTPHQFLDGRPTLEEKAQWE